MEFFDIAVAVAGLFFAGIVKGATGLGYSSCALPFLTAAVGLKPAIVLVVFPAMAANIAVLWSAGHFRETLWRFSPFYAATIPGVCVGILGLSWVDQKYSQLVLGCLIVVYSIYSIFRPEITLPLRYQAVLQVPSGLLNGFFTGLTGSQVFPLLPYMLSLKLDPDRFVQAINISVTISAAMMAIALWVSGMMTLPGLVMSSLSIIPAMVGITLGTRVRRRLPTTQFRTIVLIILGILGLTLIIRH
jgi:uncharacterized membrane protein YfcA